MKLRTQRQPEDKKYTQELKSIDTATFILSKFYPTFKKEEESKRQAADRLFTHRTISNSMLTLDTVDKQRFHYSGDKEKAVGSHLATESLKRDR